MASPSQFDTRVRNSTAIRLPFHPLMISSGTRIPARNTSTRPPGKPLRDVAGKPTIARALEHAVKRSCSGSGEFCVRAAIGRRKKYVDQVQ